MTKDQYKEQKENILENQRMLTKKLSNLKEKYIEVCAPCKIDDRIKLTHNSGRIENMVVKGFGIYREEVFIEKFNKIKSDGSVESTFRYISTGHGKIEKL